MQRGALTAGAAAFVLASAAAAQTVKLDARAAPVVFRQAVLGWCAEHVLGKARIPHDLHPEDDSKWVDLRQDAQVTGGQRIFSGRVSRTTGVIVDLAPQAVSCFVQMDLPPSGLPSAESLRKEIASDPSAKLLQEVSVPEGHATIYGLIKPDSDQIAIFSISDTPGNPQAVTAVVGTGVKGPSK